MKLTTFILILLTIIIVTIPVVGQLNISGNPPLPLAFGGTASNNGSITGNGTTMNLQNSAALQVGTTNGTSWNLMYNGGVAGQIVGASQINAGLNGGSSGILGMAGATSGTATLATNAVSSRITANVPMVETSNVVALTADWTCGTGGTVSSCTAAVIIGSGGGVPLTFTLPLEALSWKWVCDGVVGQATAVTANSWNVITATNAPTNLEANYNMATAATAFTGGALTGVSSTTTQVIGPTWTLGGTATKMPFHIEGRIEGASASGTVLSLQLVAPTVADLVTIYRGANCRIF